MVVEGIARMLRDEKEAMVAAEPENWCSRNLYKATMYTTPALIHYLGVSTNKLTKCKGFFVAFLDLERIFLHVYALSLMCVLCP